MFPPVVQHAFKFDKKSIFDRDTSKLVGVQDVCYTFSIFDITLLNINCSTVKTTPIPKCQTNRDKDFGVILALIFSSNGTKSPNLEICRSSGLVETSFCARARLIHDRFAWSNPGNRLNFNDFQARVDPNFPNQTSKRLFG